MVVANLFGMFEGPELLIIFAVIVLLFGGAKLPELARSLGRAKREFHEAINEPSVEAPQQDSAATPSTDLSEGHPVDDTVTVSRTELERLRAAAAQAHPHTPN
jgi:sec-independent protein translocase protein TatA